MMGYQLIKLLLIGEMASVSPVINGVFLTLLVGWVCLMALVYRPMPSAVLTSNSVSVDLPTDAAVEAVEADLSAPTSRRRLSASTSERAHPFLSNQCYDIVQYLQGAGSKQVFRHNQAYVIMPVHNPDKALLVESIKSILKNSDVGEHASVQLKQVLILDDFSNSPVSTWSEWSQLTEAQRKTVKFLRSSSSRKGYVVAKSNAVKFLQDKIDASIVRDKIMLIFLDKLSIVSPNWLQPLASSLDKYSNALVYPAVDVLVEGKAANKKFEVIRADDMVAGFTWSFLPRWESVSDSNRLKFATNLDEESSSIEVFSPAVPSVFAIALDHFLLMEGFDQTLHASEYAQENVDLSIRTWLCGGSVIQQTCSRVAQPFNNLLQDGHVGVEVRQRDIDSNVMNMAQRYLSLPVFNDVSGDNVAGFKNVHNLHRQAGFTYRELAFQSRFKDRVPYTVDTSIDPVRSGPVQSSLFPGESVIGTKGNNQGTFCTNFMWLVQEVYPALSQDIESTLKSYHNAHNRPDSVSQRALSKMIDEIYHLKPIEVSKGASLTLASREDFLNAQAGYVLGMQQSQDFKIKHHFTPPKEVAKPKEPQLVDMLEIHARDVRETLECTDFEDYRKGASHIDHYCAGITSNGDPGVCRTMKAKLLFNCPKSCGFCDGDNFCEDFFLNKCVTWKQQGLCGTIDKVFGDISANCRKTCAVCTPEYLKDGGTGNADIGKAAAVAEVQKPAAIENHALPPRKVQAADSLRDSNDLDANPLVVDPTLAHREYLEGKLPDEFPHFTGGDACGIKNTGDGLLLSRIEVNHNFDSNTETHGVKIFCGIYTMEKNHATNVMATKNTWAKKCDGFIAFSTKTDETIPAMEIHHEGEESYDNMWQKSRSIWKAVHRHLHDQFDFFVLGGDDMFYIVENLRAYLNSDEIHAARESSKGLFIGRIFQPPNQVIFNSGGAGYIVDQKALNVLGQNLDLPHCWPHQHGFWEDVNVASCLKTSPENIVPYQTRDTNGRERFHPFNPGNHLQYRIPKNPDWYAKYNPDLKIGYECCSSESISFHYLPEKSLYKMHNFLYHCSNK